MDRNPAAPRSPAYQMANQLMQGRLADRLKELRDKGLSFDAIARTLHRDADVVTTGTTVASWCRALGIDPVQESA
jgi:intein-encoded DNA endonuclease-like protein